MIGTIDVVLADTSLDHQENYSCQLFFKQFKDQSILKKFHFILNTNLVIGTSDVVTADALSSHPENSVLYDQQNIYRIEDQKTRIFQVDKNKNSDQNTPVYFAKGRV